MGVKEVPNEEFWGLDNDAVSKKMIDNCHDRDPKFSEKSQRKSKRKDLKKKQSIKAAKNEFLYSRSYCCMSIFRAKRT